MERKLKKNEKRFLKLIFGETLPLDKINFKDDLGLGDRPYTLPNLLDDNYTIHIGPERFNLDLTNTKTHRKLLAHECTHVWQGVHGSIEWDYVVESGFEQVLGELFGNGQDDAYEYESGNNWDSYNVEQQASIVEDWAKAEFDVFHSNWRYVRDNIRKPSFSGIGLFIKNRKLYYYYPRVMPAIASTQMEYNVSDFFDQNIQIDCALNKDNEYIYLFSGINYYRYNRKNKAIDAGYPKLISSNWPNFMHNGVDAAINWGNNKVYFFKGNEYIRMTINYGIHDMTLDPDYPKLISENWPNFMHNGIDFALNINGKAYFFKGDDYIRKTIGKNVRGQDSGYPKDIRTHWGENVKNCSAAIFINSSST